MLPVRMVIMKNFNSRRHNGEPENFCKKKPRRQNEFTFGEEYKFILFFMKMLKMTN